MSRRLLAATVLVVLSLTGTAAAHGLLDHPAPTFAPAAPASSTFNSGGQDAEWKLVTSIPTGNPQTDLDFFTKGADTYASVGTLAAGPNAAGQSIIRLTEGGTVKPSYVTGHPSATCVTNPGGALGLQHDVEATPKGGAILNTANPFVVNKEAQLLVDASDQRGRCHDGGVFGLAGTTRGGLELIDIADPAKPKEIGLTSHIGESHTVNVDPKRPHIAYSVTSDAVTLDGNGKRDNEKAGNAQAFNLDGFEVVDMSSCMNLESMDLSAKRAACRPKVYRYRYPTVEMALGHSVKSRADITDQVFGCHELEIYPDDKLTCGSGGALIVLDVKDAFDDNGTPSDYSDDTPKGRPLDCFVRPSSSAPVPPGLRTGAMVTDCVNGGPTGNKPLTVPEWLADGAPSLTGVKHLGSVYHAGRASATGAASTFPSTEDVDFNHEAEFTASGKFLLATDERGGGVLPPGATCSPGADTKQGNGGVHAYRADAISTSTPSSPEEAYKAYARTPQGQKAIFRATIRTQPQGSVCTAHVLQQVPGQNRIFMGWYSQGTQVIDFTENADGTFEFKEAGFFIPENANTWVSHVFKVEENANGSFTYYGATGDFALSGGRNTVDIYKVTLPGPPTPGGTTATSSGGTPTTPAAPAAPANPAAVSACASSLAFRSATARSRGRGLSFGFSRRGSGGVTVDVFRTSKGGRVTGERRVKRFTNKTRNFSWNGRGRGVRDGYYFVRFTVRAASGRKETRRVALVRRNGRFRGRPLFSRRDTCDLLQTYKLERPAFGGTSGRSLGISFRVAQSARVAITVRRGSKTVKRFAARSYEGGKTYRLRLGAKGLRKGDYKLTLVARRGTSRATSVLTARKL